MSHTYSKGDIMNWDEPEFNYFMSLDDMTKVYYMHDYLYGELEEEDFSDDEFDDLDEPMFTFIPEKEDKNKKTTKVNVILDIDTLWITCESEKLINETIRMFVMDGLLLQLEESFGDTRRYTVIKQGSPISIN